MIQIMFFRSFDYIINSPLQQSIHHDPVTFHR